MELGYTHPCAVPAAAKPTVTARPQARVDRADSPLAAAMRRDEWDRTHTPTPDRGHTRTWIAGRTPTVKIPDANVPLRGRGLRTPEARGGFTTPATTPPRGKPGGPRK